MIPDIKPGDILGVSGKSPMSWLIQLGTVSLPNIGPLGRWGVAGISHVGIVALVQGELVVYESTSFPRPPCVRTNRQNPKGVQVHMISDFLDYTGDVFHYPLRRPLYYHEEERLLETLDPCVGANYDYFGAGLAWGGVLKWLLARMWRNEDLGDLFCSELVAHAWARTGIFQCRNAETFNPARLIRHAVRSGIIEKGRLIR